MTIAQFSAAYAPTSPCSVIGAKPISDTKFVGDDAADRSRACFEFLTQVTNDNPQIFNTWFLFRTPTCASTSVTTRPMWRARTPSTSCSSTGQVQLLTVTADDPLIKIDKARSPRRTIFCVVSDNLDDDVGNPQAGEELFGIERLGHEVVRAEIERGDLLINRISG